MDLTYRSLVFVEALEPNECTIHRAITSQGARYWLLWFYVYRDDRAGVLEGFAVPVAPNGTFTESGPGGRTWALMKVSDSIWQVAPSIDVLSDGDARRAQAGQSRSEQSIWHQTPRVVGVPVGEPWVVG